MTFPKVQVDFRISIFSIGTLLITIATMLIGFGHFMSEFAFIRKHIENDEIHLPRITHEAMAKDIEETKDAVIRLDGKLDAWILKQSE